MADVIELVKAAIDEHGAPEFIRSDKGSAFIARDLQCWLAKPMPSHHFSQPTGRTSPLTQIPHPVIISTRPTPVCDDTRV